MKDIDELKWHTEDIDEENDKQETKKKASTEYAERAFLEHMPERSYQSEYNAKRDRRKIDDPNKRKKYKEKTFGNKKTIKDPYTGEKLHSSSEAAKKKYKSKATKHASQTDHTVPCEQIWNRNKNNPFLSDKDLKEIANIDSNYKQINQKTNQEKGGKTNAQYVKGKLKKGEMTSDQAAKMVGEGVKAEIAVGLKTAELTIKGAHKAGNEAGKEGVQVALAISSVEHAKRIIDGNEDWGEAILGIGIDTAEGYATAYGETIVYSSAEGCSKEVADFIEKIGEKTSSKAIKKISQKASDSILKNCTAENFGKTAAVISKINNIMDRYQNGEIDDDEVMDSFAEAGIEMAAGEIGKMAGEVVGQYVGGAVGSVGGPIGTAIGASVGKFVGTVVGYVVSTVICNCMKIARDKALGEEYKRRAKEFKEIAERNRQYRIALEARLNQISEDHRRTFNFIFEEMHDGIVNNNSEQITESLSALCDNFGVKIAFENEVSFKRFMADPKAKLIL